MKSVKDSFLDAGVGVFCHKEIFQCVDVVVPWRVSILVSTGQDMQGRFWLVAPGASVMGLFAPVFEGNANSTVLRGVFRDSATVVKLEGHHEISASIPINVGDLRNWKGGSRLEVVCVCPVIDGSLVLK